MKSRIICKDSGPACVTKPRIMMASMARTSVATEASAGSQKATPYKRYDATAAMTMIPPIAQETPTICANLNNAVILVARNSKNIGSR